MYKEVAIQTMKKKRIKTNIPLPILTALEIVSIQDLLQNIFENQTLSEYGFYKLNLFPCGV